MNTPDFTEAAESFAKSENIMRDSYEFVRITYPFQAGALHGWNEARRWIPVSERLPDLTRHKLIDVWIDKHKPYRLTNYQLWIFRDQEELMQDFQLNRITHWMELPSPPKTESK